MALFARLGNLLRGTLGQWLRRREHRNPGAVYEAAIQTRLAQYEKLRAAAAGVIYVRTKLGRELEAKTAALARLRPELDLAVERDDDAVALALIERRKALAADVDRLRTELAELATEAEAAKRNLVAFHGEIARLRDEKARMLARLAHAKVRLRLHETLSGVSADADVQALDSVRDHVNALLAEVELARELGDQELERRLGAVRDAEAAAAARAELEELKRARRERTHAEAATA
ncbi:MAG TPA: PspA/IM30 family protein [Candidatus Binatia bacterium]|nr:PspA/IM30 family protein [Candidatus Binatia bacterium]